MSKRGYKFKVGQPENIIGSEQAVDLLTSRLSFVASDPDKKRIDAGLIKVMQQYVSEQSDVVLPKKPREQIQVLSQSVVDTLTDTFGNVNFTSESLLTLDKDLFVSLSKTKFNKGDETNQRFLNDLQAVSLSNPDVFTSVDTFKMAQETMEYDQFRGYMMYFQNVVIPERWSKSVDMIVPENNKFVSDTVKKERLHENFDPTHTLTYFDSVVSHMDSVLHQTGSFVTNQHLTRLDVVRIFKGDTSKYPIGDTLESIATDRLDSVSVGIILDHCSKDQLNSTPKSVAKVNQTSLFELTDDDFLNLPTKNVATVNQTSLFELTDEDFLNLPLQNGLQM